MIGLKFPRCHTFKNNSKLRYALDVHKIKINELTIKHTLKSLPQKLSYLNDQKSLFL